MSALAELLAGRVLEFGREGAAADARRVRLGDAEHETDRRWAEARTRRRGAAHRVRAGRRDRCHDRRQAARPARLRIICARRPRSEEHTSELQSLMRISYAVFCLKKKKKK